MKIKRRFEMSIDTSRKYIIRQSVSDRPIACAECGESMLRVDQAAAFFSIRQRRIFQIIETDAAHFTETETGAAMICLTFLATALDEVSPEDQKSRLDKRSKPPD